MLLQTREDGQVHQLSLVRKNVVAFDSVSAHREFGASLSFSCVLKLAAVNGFLLQCVLNYGTGFSEPPCCWVNKTLKHIRQSKEERNAAAINDTLQLHRKLGYSGHIRLLLLAEREAKHLFSLVACLGMSHVP